MPIFWKRTALIFCFVALIGCGEDLREYAPIGCNFEIMLPGRPNRSTVMARPEKEIQFSKRFFLKKYRDYIEIIQTNYIPGTITKDNYEAYFDWAVLNISERLKGKIISQKFIDLDVGTGKEYHIEAPITKIHSRIYCVENTIYFLLISIYEFEPTIKDPDAIMNSFRVIKNP